MDWCAPVYIPLPLALMKSCGELRHGLGWNKVTLQRVLKPACRVRVVGLGLSAGWWQSFLDGGPPGPQLPPPTTELHQTLEFKAKPHPSRVIKKTEMDNKFLCIQKLFLSSPPLWINLAGYNAPELIFWAPGLSGNNCFCTLFIDFWKTIILNNKMILFSPPHTHQFFPWCWELRSQNINELEERTVSFF